MACPFRAIDILLASTALVMDIALYPNDVSNNSDSICAAINLSQHSFTLSASISAANFSLRFILAASNSSSTPLR